MLYKSMIMHFLQFLQLPVKLQRTEKTVKKYQDAIKSNGYACFTVFTVSCKVTKSRKNCKKMLACCKKH